MLSQNASSLFPQAVTLAAILLLLSLLPLPQDAYGRMSSPLALQSRHGLGLESQSGPQPPCGTSPVPYYPDPDQSANVKSWSKADFGRDFFHAQERAAEQVLRSPDLEVTHVLFCRTRCFALEQVRKMPWREINAPCKLADWHVLQVLDAHDLNRKLYAGIHTPHFVTFT